MKATSVLSQQDVDFFRTNGYYLNKQQLFSPDKMDRLEEIFDEHLAEKGDKLSDELDTPHFRDPRLLEFLLSDEVLDLVEPLVGPDIALWTSHFISKDPYVGRATPWHEDSAYWNGRLSAYDHIVTVWLALGPSNQENGCMRVIPGTHDNGFSDDYRPTDKTVQTFHAEIVGVDEDKAVVLRARARAVVPARRTHHPRREAQHQQRAANRLHDAVLPRDGARCSQSSRTPGGRSGWPAGGTARATPTRTRS